MPHVRHRSELVNVDTGQLVGRCLKGIAVVIRLDEFALVCGRAPGRRDWWWLERFAEVCENLPDRPWLCDERNQPDVAAAHRALERKPSPSRARSFAQAIREVSCERGF